MNAEIHGAIVGGVIGGALSGAVVFGAIALEKRLGDRAEQRRRRQELVAACLRSYLAAVARNVRAKGDGDYAIIYESGAEILGATGQLVVLGPPEVTDALVRFDRSSRDLGTPEGQNALLELLHSVRTEVLPGEPTLDREAVRRLLFEKPT